MRNENEAAALAAVHEVEVPISPASLRKIRRYTPEQKHQFVEEFSGLKMTRAAFCREKGIGYLSFCQWLKKAGKKSVESEVPVFREISLIGGSRFGVMEVEFVGKGVVRVEAGCPESWVKAVLEKL